MTDPERVIMKASAQALALDPDRIHGGVSTREALTLEEVGFALAGMRDAGIPDPVIRRVAAALHYLVLGDPQARWDLYQILVTQGRTAIEKGRWPERIDGRLYHEPLAGLAIYASAVIPLDELLAGREATVWTRDLAPRYRELRHSMHEWCALGMRHVRERTAEAS